LNGPCGPLDPGREAGARTDSTLFTPACPSPPSAAQPPRVIAVGVALWNVGGPDGQEVGTIALRKGFFEKYNKNYLFRFSLPHSLRLQAGPASATLNRHGTRRVPSKRPALKRYILAQR
jgi:hypothetical protein